MADSGKSVTIIDEKIWQTSAQKQSEAYKNEDLILPRYYIPDSARKDHHDCRTQVKSRASYSGSLLPCETSHQLHVIVVIRCIPTANPNQLNEYHDIFDGLGKLQSF